MIAFIRSAFITKQPMSKTHRLFFTAYFPQPLSKLGLQA